MCRGVDYLNAREWAGLSLVAVLLLYSLSSAAVRRSLASAARTFFGRKVWPVFAIYFTWIAVAVYAASQLGIWNQALLPATVLWCVTAGFAVVFRFEKVEKPHFMRRGIISLLTVTILVEAFVNLYVFPYWGELLLQSALFGAVFTSTYGTFHPDFVGYKPGADKFLGFVGGGLLLFNGFMLIRFWSEIDWSQYSAELLLPIWLGLAGLPLVYVIGLYAQYETRMIHLGFANRNEPVHWHHRLALYLVLNIQAHKVSQFKAPYLYHLKTSTGLRDAITVVRHFERQLRKEQNQERQGQQNLVRFSGVNGEDDGGGRLDRREFEPTRGALERIATCMPGWYDGNGGRFLDILHSKLFDEFDGLPMPSGIRLEVSPDGQAWRAWRRTPGNWIFGIGGQAGDVIGTYYEGAEPPTGYPGESEQWFDAMVMWESPNWRDLQADET